MSTHFAAVRDLLSFSRPRVIKGYWPEATCVLAVLVVAITLRIHGHNTHFNDPVRQQRWEIDSREWPILIGADTLLCLQTMLRFAVIVPLLMRGCTSTPIYGDCAALWLFGGLARFYLFVGYGAAGAYTLDGPLGGVTPFLFETACLPILVGLAWNAIRTRPLQLTAAAAAAAVSVSLQNYLRLEGGGHADQLFMLANVCDLEAAIAYALTTVLVDSSFELTVPFVHIMMPLQAAAAAYYFEMVFQYDKAAAQAAGSPIALFRIGAMTQLCIYSLAASMHAYGWKWNSRKIRKALGAACVAKTVDDDSEV